MSGVEGKCWPDEHWQPGLRFALQIRWGQSSICSLTDRNQILALMPTPLDVISSTVPMG